MSSKCSDSPSAAVVPVFNGSFSLFMLLFLNAFCRLVPGRSGCLSGSSAGCLSGYSGTQAPAKRLPSLLVAWPAVLPLLLVSLYSPMVQSKQPTVVNYAYEDLTPSPWSIVRQSGTVPSPHLRELSGLAASYLYPGDFWAINDGGNTSRVFRINSSGEVLGFVNIRARNRDWEDLTSFVWQGESYIAIADTGDNSGRRSSLTMLIISESELVRAGGKSVRPREIVFAYEDGPRDCEAVSFSPADSAFYLLSKRDVPPRLYRLAVEPKDFVKGNVKPLDEASALSLESAKQSSIYWQLQKILPKSSLKLRQAQFIAEVRTIPQPSFADLTLLFGIFSSQPTAMEFHPQYAGLMVQSYFHAYWFPYDHSWSVTLGKVPELVSLPRLTQTEAMAFSVDAKSLLVGSEGKNAKLLEVKLPEATQKPK